MSLITVNVSNQFLFIFVGLQLAIFWKITGDNCRLHPLFINMKLKVTMYFFKNGCTYIRCAPNGFAIYLE